MHDEALSARRPPEWEFWFGVVFFIATLVLGAYLSYGVMGMWRDNDALPVQQLLIHGDRRLVTDQEVKQKLLANGPLPSLTQLKVDEVRAQLQQLPWVDDVAVRKEWPAQLHVHLLEYQPVAKWQNNQMVTKGGRLFSVPDPSRGGRLPQILAEDELVEETLAMLAAVSQRTAQPELQVLQLDVSPRQAWRLKLVNGIELILGREQRIARFERFLSLLPTLQEANEALPLYVDLRYDTGAAVGWPELNQQERTSQDGEK